MILGCSPSAARNLCIALLLFPILAQAQLGKFKYVPGGDFFSEPILRTFQFQITPAGLAQLAQSPQSYVTGQIVEAGHVFTNVAIHLRGHGSFRTLEDKPSFSVKFDKFKAGQTYRGLEKLLFNNSAQDDTGFAEFVARGLFRDAGQPATRVTHAQVRLNDRDLGLYVILEAENREFLKQFFRNPNGNLYEANLTDIDVPMEQDNGTRSNQVDRIRLAEVCAMTNDVERSRELPKLLDVNSFISFAAMEMLTAHWDGYVLHTNNYRLYHEPATARFHFIPHGLDWAFLRPGLSIEPPRKATVARAVLNTAEGQQRYRERVGSLFTNVFALSTISNRVANELAKIKTGSLSSKDVARAESGTVRILDRVRARMAQASTELAGIKPVPIAFATNGTAPLLNWRADHDGGTGAVDQVVLEGKPSLHIGAAGGYYHPSWRCLAYLPRGSYRYEGRLRIVSKGPIAAMLRISGPTAVSVITAPTDWKTVSFDFPVNDDGNDVEFVCDFSGAEGEAWFELGSLQVRKLP